MTRRLIVFRLADAYLVSQKFHGEKSEAEKIYGNTHIKVDWSEVVELFDRVKTAEEFKPAVRSIRL